MYMNIYSSTIQGRNNPNALGWMEEQIEVYQYSDILFNYKKEQSTDTCYNVGETWTCYSQW